MTTENPNESRLQQSLNSLQKAVDAWDPEAGGTTGHMLSELREVQLHFDPRKSRLPSALCLGSMRLLEEIEGHGSVRPEVAVTVVRELTEQLRTALENSSKSAAPSGAFRVLQAATPPAQGAEASDGSSSEQACGLSLKLVDDLRIGEMMVKMSIISQQDCDRVLHAQSENLGRRRRFGETCVEMGLISDETLHSVVRMHERSRGAPAQAPLGLNDPWGDKPL